MSTPDIAAPTWHELMSLRGAQDGLDSFRDVLDGIGDNKRKLLGVFGDFAEFNADAAAGVLDITTKISRRRDLFRESDHPVAAFSDRSFPIGQRMLFAGLDEYGFGADAMGGISRGTHRELAIILGESAGALLGFKGKRLDKLLQPNMNTRKAAGQLLEGYCPEPTKNGDTLFISAGHHLASEKLADPEFAMFYDYLCKKWPDLIKKMKRNHSDKWLEVHGTTEEKAKKGKRGVETDHADKALEGMGLMMKYYCGNKSLASLRKLVLEGFQNFARLQAKFYKHIGERP